MTPEKKKELLTALSKGNQSAFDSLYLFYAPKVREFVFRLLKTPAKRKTSRKTSSCASGRSAANWAAHARCGVISTRWPATPYSTSFSHSIVEDKYMQEHINSAAERRDAPLSEKIETEGWPCSSPSPWTACPNSAAGFSA